MILLFRDLLGILLPLECEYLLVVLGRVYGSLVYRYHQEERRPLVIIASRFEFEAREYGVAIHQGLLLVAFQAYIVQLILTDDLELCMILRIPPSLSAIEQVPNRSTSISLHCEDFCIKVWSGQQHFACLRIFQV